MKRKEFDKKLMDKLEGFDSKVDVQDIWSAIESDVDAINDDKKGKRRMLIWLFSFLVGSLMVIGVFLMKNDVQKESQVSQLNVVLESVIATPEDKRKMNVNSNSNMSTGVIRNTKDVVEDKSKADIDANELDDVGENLEVNTLIQPNLPTDFSMEDKMKKGDLKHVDEEIQKNVFEETPILNSTLSPKGLPSTSGIFIETKTQEKALLSVVFLEKRKKQPSIFLEVENPKLDWDRNLQQIYYPHDGRKRFNYSVEILGGISQTNRSLTVKGNEFNDYLNQRDQTEQTLETIHLGIHGSILHRSGWELTTGIDLTQINEELNYQNSETTFDTISNQVWGFAINPYGDTTEIYDDVINSRTTIFTKRTFNNYRMLDIPILIGYHKTRLNWSVGLQVGIVANLRLKTTGAILNANESFTDLEASSDFKSNVGLSYYLGASGKYFITNNLHISLNPFFRFFPKSFTAENYPLKQNYQLLGGSLGIGFRF